MKKVIIGLIAGLGLFLSACQQNPTDQVQAKQSQQALQAYVPHNDIEFNNYNKRQVIADDPTTLLWCTSAFPIPGSPMFTVPIVGKLTSSGKRPAQLPDGVDGMSGSSSEYRYGFTPAGVYVDFYNLQTFCTTQPTVFQRDSTKIVMQIAGNLQDAQKQAQAALKAGNPGQADRILQQAIGVK